MMKFFAKSPALILALVLFIQGVSVTTANAQETTVKLGFIDLELVFKSTTTFLAVKESVDQETRNRAEKVNQLKSQFRSDMNAFNMQKDLLEDSMIEQRQKELEQNYKKILGTMQDEEKELADYQKKLLDPAIKELKDVVAEIAKKEGYGFIFKKSEIGWADEKYNITDKVIQAMNANAKK